MTAPACPRCRARRLARITRRPWMRLLPATQRFICDGCHRTYLWLGGVLWPLGRRMPKTARKR